MASRLKDYTDQQLEEAIKNATGIVNSAPSMNEMDENQRAVYEKASRAVRQFSLELANRRQEEPGSDLPGRITFGQGLAMGAGDEAEAFFRSQIFGEDYTTALKDVRQKIEATRRADPGGSALSELAGGLAPAGVAIATTMLSGGSSAPATGPMSAQAVANVGRNIGLLSNMARGAGRGAAIGGAQSGVEGFARGEGGIESRAAQGLKEAPVGAGFGAGLGAVVPAAKAVIGGATLSPERLARRRLLDLFSRENVTPQEVRKAYEEAQAAGVKPEILADIFPGGDFTRETSRLYQTASGGRRREMSKQLMERARGQGERVQSAFEEALGTRQKMFDAIDDLESARRVDAAPLYDAAYQVPVSREARRTIDSLMTRAPDEVWSEVRDEARDQGLQIRDLVQTDRQGRKAVYGDYTIKEVDLFKRGLDGVIEENTINGKMNRKAVRAYNIKRALLKKADEISPEYAAARQAWAGPTAALNAIEDGRKIFGDRAENIVKRINRMDASEREAFMIGTLDAINQRLGRGVDTQDATKQFLSGNARNQIRAGLSAGGKNNEEINKIADALFENVEREAQMAATKNRVLGGSQTGERVAAELEARSNLGALSQIGKDITMGRPIVSSLLSPLDRAATNIATGMSRNRMDQTNELLRNYLMSSTPAGVRNMTNAMLQEAARIGRFRPTTTYVPGLLADPLTDPFVSTFGGP